MHANQKLPAIRDGRTTLHEMPAGVNVLIDPASPSAATGDPIRAPSPENDKDLTARCTPGADIGERSSTSCVPLHSGARMLVHRAPKGRQRIVEAVTRVSKLVGYGLVALPGIIE